MRHPTPGPWRQAARIERDRIICGADDVQVAVLHDGMRPARETEANASLIATAPVLDAALKRQTANIECWLTTGRPATPEEGRSIYEQLVAALARAEERP